MLKLICNNDNCQNKNVAYYDPQATNPTMCGACKQNITPVEMSQQEFDEVFDYDPYAKSSLGIE